jgi:protoheme IX farnesyltransferase
MTEVNQTSSTAAQFEEIKHYLSLLKPRVMSLVVFTAICGLLVAPGDINLLVGIIAIICISFGSGASGAINMWYERAIDAKMKRTQGRPLPQGKLSPENALEFAGVLAFVSVLVMAFAVNLTSAALLLAAILFYVFIYTIWLKPRTPQNIVIGGAAGAFPPMIGWAAVTGDISVHSFILFAIIFLWTPPHFWALSIYRNEDYTKAGIPMMPVVHGVEETKKQILFYSVILFAVTLLPYFVSNSGITYLVSAVILGILFIYHAFNIYREPSEKNCKILFGYSIIYLFVLFTLLVVDHYIHA